MPEGEEIEKWIAETSEGLISENFPKLIINNKP